MINLPIPSHTVVFPATITHYLGPKLFMLQLHFSQCDERSRCSGECISICYCCWYKHNTTMSDIAWHLYALSCCVFVISCSLHRSFFCFSVDCPEFSCHFSYVVYVMDLLLYLWSYKLLCCVWCLVVSFVWLPWIPYLLYYRHVHSYIYLWTDSS